MQGILYSYTIHSALFLAGHAGYPVFLYHTLCTLLSWSCRVSCILIPYTLHSSQLVMQGILYSYTIHSALFSAGHAGYPVFLYHTLCTLLSWSCRVSCILIPYTLHSSQLVMQGILYSYTIHSALFSAGHAGYPVFLYHTLCTLLSWSCRVSCILIPYIHSALFSAGHAGYPVFLYHTLCTLLSWSCRVSCILIGSIPYTLHSSQLVMQGILYSYTIHSALFSAGHAGYPVFLYHTLCTLLSWSCMVSCILIPYTLHSSQLVMQGILYSYTIHSALFLVGHAGYPVFLYHIHCTLLSWSCRVSCILIPYTLHSLFCTLLSWSCRVSCILIHCTYTLHSSQLVMQGILYSLITASQRYPGAHTLWSCMQGILYSYRTHCTYTLHSSQLVMQGILYSYRTCTYTLHSSQLVMQGILYSYTIHSALFSAGHAGYPVFLYHTLCTLLSWSCRVSCILIPYTLHSSQLVMQGILYSYTIHSALFCSWSCRVSCILIPYTLHSSQLVMQGILYSYTIHSALFSAGHAGYPVFLYHTLCTLLSWSCRVSCILIPYTLHSSQLVMQGILYSYTIHSALFSAGHAGYPVFLYHTLCTLLSWSCIILYSYTIHSALFSAGHAGYPVFLYHTLCTLLSWSCRVSCILIPYTLHSSELVMQGILYSYTIHSAHTLCTLLSWSCRVSCILIPYCTLLSWSCRVSCILIPYTLYSSQLVMQGILYSYTIHSALFSAGHAGYPVFLYHTLCTLLSWSCRVSCILIPYTLHSSQLVMQGILYSYTIHSALFSAGHAGYPVFLYHTLCTLLSWSCRVSCILIPYTLHSS